MSQQFQITTENLHKFLQRFVQPNLSFTIKQILKRDEVSQYSNNNYLWRVKVQVDHSAIRANRRIAVFLC